MSIIHILDGFTPYLVRSGSSGPWNRNPLNNVAGTYCIIVIETGMIYIGSSTVLAKRVQAHQSYLRNNTHVNYNLQEAYNDNPEIEILIRPMYSIDDAQALEQYLVDYFKDTGYLCNIAIADVTRSRLGRPLTDEHKRVIGDSNRGRPRYDLRRPQAEAAKQQGIVSRKAFYQTEEGRASLLARSKPITIDGIHYPSMSEAGRLLQKPLSAIRNEKMKQFN